MKFKNKIKMVQKAEKKLKINVKMVCDACRSHLKRDGERQEKDSINSARSFNHNIYAACQA